MCDVDQPFWLGAEHHADLPGGGDLMFWSSEQLQRLLKKIKGHSVYHFY